MANELSLAEVARAIGKSLQEIQSLTASELEKLMENIWRGTVKVSTGTPSWVNTELGKLLRQRKGKYGTKEGNGSDSLKHPYSS